MLKKFLSDKINGTKNALFFLLRAPTHCSFTFNLQFLYELMDIINPWNCLLENANFSIKTTMTE